MKSFQISFFLFYSLLFPFFCHAQEEVIFNDINIDKKEIKVEKTVQGIELGTNLFSLLEEHSSVRYVNSGSAEVHIGYFHEQRIANVLTLNKAIRLKNSFNNYDVYHYDETTGFGSFYDETEYRYELDLELKIEPRWYFSHTSRYMGNKKTLNNSGWFLSIPVSISTWLLHQPSAGYRKWTPYRFSINVSFPLAVGYRGVFNKNLFIEGSLAYVPYYFGTNFQHTYSYLSFESKYLSTWLNSEIKIAYTF